MENLMFVIFLLKIITVRIRMLTCDTLMCWYVVDRVN